jgi:putative phosphoribosyl transferase
MFQDRKHAAHLLAEKLIEYKGQDKDAIVVAIPRGGVQIGHDLAVALGLPLDIIPSKRIKNPSNPNQSIGSVSLDGVDILPNNVGIPQDYVYHQIAMIQRALRHQYEQYVGSPTTKDLTNKILLVVDDRMNSVSQFLACYRGLAKKLPKKIIAVVPVLTNDSLRRLKEENCEVVYIDTTCHANLNDYYTHLPNVSDEEVIQLLHRGKCTV